MFLPPDEEVARTAVDLQIAATALRHSYDDQVVTVVHSDSDSDFGYLARVRPDLRTRWIVPPGSVG